jgi:hypothetical protein
MSKPTSGRTVLDKIGDDPAMWFEGVYMEQDGRTIVSTTHLLDFVISGSLDPNVIRDAALGVISSKTSFENLESREL